MTRLRLPSKKFEEYGDKAAAKFQKLSEELGEEEANFKQFEGIKRP